MFAAVGYGATRGRRDFTSESQMVAGRYDVLCQPRNAEKARELLAKLAMGPGRQRTPRAVSPPGRCVHCQHLGDIRRASAPPAAVALRMREDASP